MRERERDADARLDPESAIETGFPVQEVNRLAASEAYNKHHYRPTNYQHKWWARRLGSVFRTLCLGALSNSEVGPEALWERYASANDFEDALVFDPFMGGGTTGQEATRLGAKFVGADLNPVAWYIARMGLAPQPDALDRHFQQVLGRSREEIQPYYVTTCPHCETEADAAFYLWVELLEEESGFEREYDTLVVDYDRDGGATVVCPRCHDISWSDSPTEAVCEACGHDFDATREDVRVPIETPTAVFNGGERPAYEPYAVKYDCSACDRRGFRAFEDFDVEVLADARKRFAERKADLPLPTQSIPEGGEKTRDLHNRNYTEWTQLFNDRQLLALGTLLEEITAVEDDLARQYLTLTFSASLEFNTMFCSYKGADPRGPGAVRHVFSHHAFVHPGEPLENNPLGSRPRQSGTFRYLYQYRLQQSLAFQSTPVERVLGEDGTVAEKREIEGERIGGEPADSVADLLDGGKTHYLHCGDSTALPVEELEADAVVTDPPYYDSVQYAELADFFYVWLTQALEDDFPEIFAAESVVSDAEAVGNRTRDKSLDDYRRLLQGVFETAADALRADGPLIFTFHHREPDAWGAVLEALDGAGFRVVQTYPVRGENRLSVHINGQRAIHLDSAIVCRTGHKRLRTDWATVEAAIRRESRKRLQRFHESAGEDLSRLDASVVVRGACLTQFSTYETVRDEDGVVSEREAMARVESITDDLNGREF